MKKTIYVVLLIFFTAMLLYSAWDLVDILGSYREGQNSYEQLEQYVSFEEPVQPTKSAETAVSQTEASEEPTDPSEPEGTEGPDLSGWPRVDFEHLSRINPDVVGWIYIRGTNINYPVVQGADNDYYLNKLFDRTRNSAGSIFLDARNDAGFSDSHSIIYGHNMKDKSMFADLMRYKDQEFYDEHFEGLLVTPTAFYRIVFFSGYVSDDWANAWELDFDDISFDEWLQSIRRRSCFLSGYAPAAGDGVVTLSTCTYEFDSAKFVLHGYIAQTIELDESGN